MRSNAPFVAVYPLLFINLAVAVLLVASARNVYLLFIEWLFRDGRLTDGRIGPIPFIIKGFDNGYVIVMALGLLAMFVVLEYSYSRGGRGQLLQRFIRFLGFEVLLLGVVHLVTDLVLEGSLLAALSSALTLLEIVAGVALVATSRRTKQRAREQSASS